MRKDYKLGMFSLLAGHQSDNCLFLAIGKSLLNIYYMSHSCCCAVGYLVCGLLCFDRFTARAFLTSRDPASETATPASAAANNFAPPRADSSSADESNTA